MENNIDVTIREIFSLYEKHGADDYIGEPVSQLEHMCQTASHAINEGMDDEEILAAFFHDIGHLCEHIRPTESMDGLGTKDHEQIGADYLKEKGFPDRVVAPVQYHVQAKRYLTYQYPEYFNSLSAASRQTLLHQGGVMDADEAAEFERHPLFELIIKVRRWDERAKISGAPILDLSVMKEKVRNVLQVTRVKN